MDRRAQLSFQTALAGFAFLISAAAPAFAAAPPEACSVVTKAEAAKALGTPITGMQARRLGPSSICTIRGAGPFKSVAVTTYGWSSVPEAQAAFQTMLSSTAQVVHPSVALPHLGDQAQQIGANVYVRKGTAAYVFNVIDGSTGAAHAAKSVALATSAMERVR